MRVTRSSNRKRKDNNSAPDALKATQESPKKRKSRSLLSNPSKLGLGSAKESTKKSRDSQEKFKYRRLNAQKNEIRLLQVLPIRRTVGHDNGIDCSLSYVSLDTRPDYEALSYVWGDMKEWRSISLENRSFLVTSNLHSALSRLQSTSISRPIWIDAICINQGNLQERSEQVVKMGKIFKHASKVIAWLGDAEDQSNLAFALLRLLKDCLDDRSQCSTILRDPDYLQHLYGIYRLFYRDYWWRVWVIQEVTLAKTITILCGLDSFLWSDLVAIQETLAAHHIEDIDFSAHDRPELSFLRVSIESRGPRAMLLSASDHSPEQPDLAQTLLKHRFKESSDPKDMIYSLVGLSTAHNDPRLVVDYTKSVREVYTGVAEYIVTTTKQLDIICAMPRGRNSHKLPSWVPDWSFSGIGSSLLEHVSKHQFGAAGTTKSEFSFSKNSTILHAKGVRLGRLTSIGATSGMDDLEDEFHAIGAFQSWQKLLSSVTNGISVLAEGFCTNVLREKYKPKELEEWQHKVDFLPWILGTFARAIMIVHPDIELDTYLAACTKRRVTWRSPEEDDVLGMILLRGATEMIYGRRTFVSDSQLIGLGPESVAKGNIICVLLGCQIPVILRPRGGHYFYLGEAFVNDYMYGKAVEDLADGRRELSDFEIH